MLLDNSVDLHLAVAAAAAGLSGSLHCMLMCGPLACAASGAGARAERRRAAIAYQAARILSYSLVGAVAGALGGAVSGGLRLGLERYAPWLLVATLLATTLDLRRWIARQTPAPGITQLLRRVLTLGAKHSLATRAGLLGALTPLLPCGLLYGMLLSASATSSTAAGAVTLGAFALGAVPALALAHLQAHLLTRAPAWVARGLERGLPALAAGMIAWRALTASAPCCH